MTPLRAFAAEADGAVLVLHDAESVAATRTLGEEGHRVHPLGSVLPDHGPWGGVLLAVTNRTELRRAAARLPPLGDTHRVACLLTREDRPAHLTSRPEWPPVAGLRARRLPTGGALTVLELARPVAADVVLQELARLAAPTRRPPEIAAETHRASGPLDEGMLNPMGFDPDPHRGLATLEVGGPTGLRLLGVADVDGIDPACGAGAHLVRALRAHRGVRVNWDAATPELSRTVAALAMAGVPLVGDPPPAASRAWLGDALHEALLADVDLADPLRREEHSIRLRRAALLTHSGPAWRDRIERAAGHTCQRFPSCSVVLSTRRPQLLDFALRQVARQRSVDVELVVVGHGFEPDRPRVRDQLGDRPVEVLSVHADTLFGEALNTGVHAASGDIVVKMDDDDWYGRDFLLDLLLAREYSGADVVGTAAEFVYLHQLDRTLRTRATSEWFAKHVAGGTLCLPRELLRSLGGFRPVRRFVDRQLLAAAAAAGASVYRAHGLGYLLRRTVDGHTWDPGLDFFLDEERVARQWQGFVPSHVLEVDPADLPARSAASEAR